jgi:iron-sulfur cluster insertion protein
MTVEAFDPGAPSLGLTPEAAAKVLEFLAEENGPKLLRVFVTGGGCSGFQYGFTFEDQQQEDDSLFTHHGVSLVVDSMSYQYLAGATVSYHESIAGSRFTISNPNASTTCGCGSSFSV